MPGSHDVFFFPYVIESCVSTDIQHHRNSEANMSLVFVVRCDVVHIMQIGNCVKNNIRISGHPSQTSSHVTHCSYGLWWKKERFDTKTETVRRISSDDPNLQRYNNDLL